MHSAASPSFLSVSSVGKTDYLQTRSLCSATSLVSTAKERNKHKPLAKEYMYKLRRSFAFSVQRKLRLVEANGCDQIEIMSNKLSGVIYDSQYWGQDDDHLMYIEQFYFYDPIKLHITLPAWSLRSAESHMWDISWE